MAALRTSRLISVHQKELAEIGKEWGAARRVLVTG